MIPLRMMAWHAGWPKNLVLKKIESEDPSIHWGYPKNPDTQKKTWCTVYFGIYKPWAFEALIVRTTPTFTVRICIWFRISTNVQTCICLDRSITLECTHLLCFPAICVQKYFGFLVFGFYDEWWHNLLWARYESPGHGRVPVYQQSNEREESRSNSQFSFPALPCK